jgi:hypothetical protein
MNNVLNFIDKIIFGNQIEITGNQIVQTPVSFISFCSTDFELFSQRYD